MKKHILKFLLGIMYIASVVALLMTHIQQIAGKLERVMAMIETLLLVIPMIVVLYLYVRVTEADKKKRAEETASEHNRKIPVSSQEELEKKMAQYGLSRREAEVAWLLYKGYTNRQVAEELFVAENTIKKHASHIYEKLHVSGRKELKEKINE